jgi:hypothetical protein
MLAGGNDADRAACVECRDRVETADLGARRAYRQHLDFVARSVVLDQPACVRRADKFLPAKPRAFGIRNESLVVQRCQRVLAASQPFAENGKLIGIQNPVLEETIKRCRLHVEHGQATKQSLGDAPAKPILPTGLRPT